MKLSNINIRDPFILEEKGSYYMYGTRAKNFGQKTGGFDVYTSSDLVNWSPPKTCFDSEKSGLNGGVNWAPEVYKYQDSYYMFATFTKKNGLRGVYILKADAPEGPFSNYSGKAVTPYDWECLDGTLYIDNEGQPYMVFCHEHTQIIDGTICYLKLSEDLKEAISEPTLIFSATSPSWVKKIVKDRHYVTDGPFMYRTSGGKLLMLWSTHIENKYVIAIARSDNDNIDGNFVHLDPLFTQDGGHSMIFRVGSKLMITYHAPNISLLEKPVIKELIDTGDNITIAK